MSDNALINTFGKERNVDRLWFKKFHHLILATKLELCYYEMVNQISNIAVLLMHVDFIVIVNLYIK